jgi:thiamine pyrophosphokinase
VLLLERLLVPTTLLDGANECQLLRDGEAVGWQPQAGEIVSLLPLTDVVSGVRTHGLRWPLEGATLHRGSTRGVSNEPVAGRVQVAIEHGRLLLTRHFPA